MTEQNAAQVWEGIVHVLDEQMQFGFLEQAKSVVSVTLEGTELRLTVAGDEAFDFFSAHVNQQRLIIVSRTTFALERVSVERVAADPIR